MSLPLCALAAIELLKSSPHKHTPHPHPQPPPQTYRRIVKVDLKFPAHVSLEAQDFIRRLLRKDPKTRMPLSKVKDHPWVVRYSSEAMASAVVPPAPSAVTPASTISALSRLPPGVEATPGGFGRPIQQGMR